jgi:malonyl-CoA/methylmalonyl-CoA synthetase
MLQLIKNALKHKHNQAIIANETRYTYQDLLDASADFAAVLLGDKEDLQEARVAFMVSPSFEYVSTQWAIWRAGGVAVPLCITYPLPSLQYVIEDTGADIIVVGVEYAALLQPLAQEKGLQFIILGEKNREILSATKSRKPSGLSGVRKLPNIETHRRAMILYTSGTTNLPKGVVTTHANIQAQIATLVKSWQWSATDHIVCILPLHHVHGIINVIGCALWSGATCTFLSQFTAEGVINAFKKGEINVFMAVPTIYFKLIAYIDPLPIEAKKELFGIFQTFRLMVSGSAALPVSVMEKWETISGHRLLERYGMTEIGMGISNPYIGERRAGYIGKPLSGVKVRLTDEQNQVVKRGQAGEIQIKGKNVFQEYWGKPEATEKTFTTDGWFKTGDIAVVERGYYRILGRDSIDIIKSGGYKISALEIEEILRTHPALSDCSVVGLPDEEWGEIVAAALILREKDIDLTELNKWLREKIPAYKTPRQYRIVEELPRNAMGKVTKNDVKLFFRHE